MLKSKFNRFQLVDRHQSFTVFVLKIYRAPTDIEQEALAYIKENYHNVEEYHETSDGAICIQGFCDIQLIRPVYRHFVAGWKASEGRYQASVSTKIRHFVVSDETGLPVEECDSESEAMDYLSRKHLYVVSMESSKVYPLWELSLP